MSWYKVLVTGRLRYYGEAVLELNKPEDVEDLHPELFQANIADWVDENGDPYKGPLGDLEVLGIREVEQP